MKELLELLKIKGEEMLNDTISITLYSDGSGCVNGQWINGVSEKEELFEFGTLEELVQYLND